MRTGLRQYKRKNLLFSVHSKKAAPLIERPIIQVNVQLAEAAFSLLGTNQDPVPE